MDIKIMPVNNENYEDIINLEIFEYQSSFIETTKQCLKEAKELSLWKPVGIYDNNILIGFSMYGKFQNEGTKGRVWLDRFLIDKKYQNRGYARPVLIKLIKLIKSEYNCSEIYLSIYEDNIKAVHLYKNLGFNFNGELDINGEKVMILKL